MLRSGEPFPRELVLRYAWGLSVRGRASGLGALESSARRPTRPPRPESRAAPRGKLDDCEGEEEEEEEEEETQAVLRQLLAQCMFPRRAEAWPSWTCSGACSTCTGRGFGGLSTERGLTTTRPHSRPLHTRRRV